MRYQQKFSLLVGLTAVFWGNLTFVNAQSSQQNRWVDSLMQTLSLEQKIGQLCMVAAYSNKDLAHENEIYSYVSKGMVGGVIFMQGHPIAQANLTNRYQAGAAIPLLVSQDAEWGLGMRLQETIKYPRQMTLGAIQNDSLIYWMGKRMGQECKRLGVHIDFAPDVDVNNNAANPVIHTRSFGENKYKVARKGLMISNGLQAGGALSCAKHFPGHGDTDTDSHLDLPVINQSLARLDTLELYPFMKLAEGGVSSIMVAHLFVPALDNTPNLPATLSPKIIQGVLRDSMHYNGLVFTDALNMQGVAKFYQPGELEVLALLAGNDILLFPQNIPVAIKSITQAVASGRISQAKIDEHVRRVLIAKYQVGLTVPQQVKLEGLMEDLNAPEAKVLRKRLFEAALTLVKNDNDLLPLANLETRKIAYLQIGGGSGNKFDQSLKKYADVTPFYLRNDFNTGERDQVLAKLKGYNTVVIGIMGMGTKATNQYGVTNQTITLAKDLARMFPATVLTVFGTPYSLRFFGDQTAILEAYEEDLDAEQAAAAAIFGGLRVNGKLPVTASAQFPENLGLSLELTGRFGFSLPEEMGMDSRVLASIDSLANHYIGEKVMPGCAVLIARGNQIVYEKGFGMTEAGPMGKPVDPFMNVYDLASVTKVAATTLVTMYLHDRGLLNVDDPIGKYLPDLQGTGKENLIIRDLLLHRAGLPPILPYKPVIHSDPITGALDTTWFNFIQDAEYPVPVAPHIYAKEALQDWVWDQIKQVPLSGKKRTVYSDLGLVMVGKAIERMFGFGLDEIAGQLFYQPLGMSRTCFNPELYGLTAVCPPTEVDQSWRGTVVQGFVHDPTAAMMGGVAGNAGLFSNIYDLTKLLMMIKNGGYYGDRLFLTQTTISNFTSRQDGLSRKGLGWDKPDIDGGTNNASQYASAETYGHTGFTGTSVWVDPVQDLIFIFLSNRTYPSSRYNLLHKERVRVQMMDKAYESIRFSRT